MSDATLRDGAVEFMQIFPLLLLLLPSALQRVGETNGRLRGGGLVPLASCVPSN